MAYRTLTSLSLTAAAALALVPDAAEACSPDPCWGLARVQEISAVNAAAIPVAGVLVLQAAVSGDLPDADIVAGLKLEVTRDGQPVAGDVETTDFPGVLVWRPAEQLGPGAYQAVGSFDNPDDDGGYDYGDLCGPDLIELDFEFAAVAEQVEPLAPPTVTAEHSRTLAASEDVGDLVCCDGAFPTENDLCGEPFGSYWSEGQCAAHSGHGWLDVQLTAQSPASPSTAGLLATTLRVDGEVAWRGLGGPLSIHRDHPVCFVVEHTNLASGESVASAEGCEGQDEAELLGPQQIDPLEQLAGCVGEPYTCVVVDEPFPRHWDAAQCSPFAPEEETTGPTTSDSEGGEGSAGSEGSEGSEGEGSSGDDGGLGDDVDLKGCGCTSGPADPGALLALAGLGLVARRRRRR
jgi:MYXO-CTERM domain-containing protein